MEPENNNSIDEKIESQPRKLVTIQIVESVQPIDGADMIECIQVLGWYLVSKKGEFAVGDKCLFFEIDSILPDLNLEVFEFMRDRKFRVKTAKFRSQISQGLALQPELVLANFKNKISKAQATFEVGTDFTELIGVTKYDPEGESLSKPPKVLFEHKYWIVRRFKEYSYKSIRWFYRSKLAAILKLHDPLLKKPFPSFVPKTDETRVQNLKSHLLANKGDICYISEKFEGQSLTAYRKDNKVSYCSRNIDVTNDETSNWVKMGLKYNLASVLVTQNKDLAIQAEIIGPGVQGNIYGLSELEIRIFYIYDIAAKRNFTLTELREFCDRYQLPLVTILNENFALPDNIDAIVALADGKSSINSKVLREGIVIVKRMEHLIDTKPYSFKAISPKYELGKEEKLEKARKLAKVESEVVS